MVAACIVCHLWPENILTQNYPHLKNKDMPGILQAFFGTIHHLQTLPQMWYPATP